MPDARTRCGRKLASSFVPNRAPIRTPPSIFPHGCGGRLAGFRERVGRSVGITGIAQGDEGKPALLRREVKPAIGSVASWRGGPPNAAYGARRGR